MQDVDHSASKISTLICHQILEDKKLQHQKDPEFYYEEAFAAKVSQFQKIQIKVHNYWSDQVME